MRAEETDRSGHGHTAIRGTVDRSEDARYSEHTVRRQTRGGGGVADETRAQGAPMETAGADGPAAWTRRRFLAVAGGGATAAGALYAGLALVERPARPVIAPPPHGYPDGQYQILDYGVRVQSAPESAVEVIVPPAWNVVITARLRRRPDRQAQGRLEAALRAVESAYPYAPTGVFALVAYGLPYFRSYVRSSVVAAHLPRMAETGAPVLLDAVRFAGDPPATRLEANDVAVHLRSDSLATLRDVQQALFHQSGLLAGQPMSTVDVSDLFHVTSIRTGFVGPGLPRQMAEKAGLAVASHIPPDAPLFMGFASTQRLGQASESAVAFDRPPDPLLKPLTTARPGDYFAGGTALHLSHVLEDLDTWYALPYEQRVARMFHLNATAPPGRAAVETLWLNPNPAAFDAAQRHIVGHNEAVQRGSRTPEGQALQLRVDFNTMDALDTPRPHPGVHFLAFTPGSEIFHRSRRAMDATDLVGTYRVPAPANGINSFIRATRRQNFLVPPRRHRAFPLIEHSA